MLRVLKFICIIWLLAVPGMYCPAQEVFKNSSTLYNKVKWLLKKHGEGDINVGIYIKDLDTGSVKFMYHPKRLFFPASIVKLFTAYEALNYLTPEYKFETAILSSEKSPQDGQFRKDLYIKFSGDPSFTYQDLKGMFEMAGVKKIGGDIVIDGTIFDEQHAAPGGFTWDDNPFYYAAPRSAIIIDKNCSEATMSPANNVGDKAQLAIVDPKLLDIKNNVRTVLPQKQDCPYKSKYLGANRYEVYGCMFNDRQKAVKLNFALQDNNLMAHNYIDKALKELGIKLKGQIKFGKVENVIALYTHKSAPLKELLKDVLGKSCNICAGSIFKHIAAKYTKQQANDDESEKVMKTLLKEFGFKGSFIIKDGLGESRYNLIAPQSVVSLLELGYKNPKIKSSFINALARYGLPGTLEFRTLGRQKNQYTYGKTGSSKTASALAGYYLPPSGPKYAFAILINNHTLPWEKVKSLEDKILHTLLSKNPSKSKTTDNKEEPQ